MNGFSVKWLNRILTTVAIVMLAVWAFKYFGAGGAGQSGVSAGSIGTGVGSMIKISLIVVCCGYLAWRAFALFYWRKYFKDQDPPENME